MNTENALVPVDQLQDGPRTLALPSALDLTAAAPLFWTSFKPTNDEERAMLLVALQESSTKLGGVLNTAFPTSNVILQAVQVADQETGELFDAARIVLIGPKGETVACVSEGAKRSLSAIMQLWGPPPWEPPLLIVPKQLETRNNRRYYLLSVTGRAAKTAARKGA